MLCERFAHSLGRKINDLSKRGRKKRNSVQRQVLQTNQNPRSTDLINARLDKRFMIFRVPQEKKKTHVSKCLGELLERR